MCLPNINSIRNRRSFGIFLIAILIMITVLEDCGAKSLIEGGYCKPITVNHNRYQLNGFKPNTSLSILMSEDDSADSIRSTNTSARQSSIYTESPTATFAIAFIPGFFVHGLGHYYIGENRKGSLLLGVEGLSILLYLAGAADRTASTFAQEDNPKPHYTDDYLLYSGLVLFLSSWAYDFIDAPKEAKKITEKLKNKVLLAPKITRQHLVYEVLWRF